MPYLCSFIRQVQFHILIDTSGSLSSLVSRTWTSDVASDTFCADGSRSCVNARLPDCQDRTILCLDKLPSISGLIKTDKTPNTTLNNFSLGAKFGYTCSTPGNTMKQANGGASKDCKSVLIHRAQNSNPVLICTSISNCFTHGPALPGPAISMYLVF